MFMRLILRIPRTLVISLVAIAAFGSGVVNLLSILGGPAPTGQDALLREIFPMEFIGLSRSVTLMAGFMLVLASLHLWRGKRRAYQLLAFLAACSVPVNLLQGPDWGEAGCSLILLSILLGFRRHFRVRSETPNLRLAIQQAVIATTVAIAYGGLGFWLLAPHEFGRNFDWHESLNASLRLLSLTGDSTLIPHTPYARWFLDSLTLMSLAAIVWTGYSLFRPVVYRFTVRHYERERAAAITALWGRSGQDFFKSLGDKSFFFGPSGESYLAYRVSGSYALVLGDPVGPPGEAGTTVRAFLRFCRDQGWRVGFHQVYPDMLPLYENLGFRRIKLGDEAIVDLTTFTLEGKRSKELRNTISKLERAGVRMVRYDSLVPDCILDQLKEVSDEWLSLPGRRERQFTLGRFDREYIRTTPVYAAIDAGNQVVAFLNRIPCYDPAKASIDLMRRRIHAPNGVMDYLFAKVFQELKSEGVAQFSLGIAPLAGFQSGESPSLEERAVHSFIRRMPFLFHFESLRKYKAKYATGWEPRYDVYRRVADLPRLALAIRRVSEIPRERAA